MSSFRKSIPTGMLAGAGGQFLASPTDRVKIIMQMEGKLVQDGHKPRWAELRIMITSIHV